MKGKVFVALMVVLCAIAPALTARAATLFTEDFGTTEGWVDGYNGWTAGYYGTVKRTTTTVLGSDPAADAAYGSSVGGTNYGWKVLGENWNDPMRIYTMTFQFAANDLRVEGGFGFASGQTVDANGYPILGLVGPWLYYNGNDNWFFVWGQNGDPGQSKWHGWQQIGWVPGFLGKPLSARIVVNHYEMKILGEITDGVTTLTSGWKSVANKGPFTDQPLNLRGAYMQGNNIENRGIAVDDVVVTSEVVPEPTALLALGTGLMALAGSVIRRRR